MRINLNFLTKTVRTVAVFLLFSGAIFGSSSSSSSSYVDPITQYKSGWTHKALQIQEKLDLSAPLKWSSFVSTHNSFNASDYATAFSYLDPNQVYSLYEQLEMDVREIELDVHWYFSMEGWPWEWQNRLLLCHGEGDHMGCSSYDRKFSDGISEINSWIRRAENRNKILIIQIEQYFDGHYSEALNTLKSYFGDLIYRPAVSCSGLDQNMPKQNILNANKQIVIVTDNGGCTTHEIGTWVFKGAGNRNGFLQSNVRSFTNYPDCASSVFSASDYANNMIRYYGDETTLNDWFGGGYSPIYASHVQAMGKCGASLISMDNIKPTDGRLDAHIWSWNGGEPNDYNGIGDCAMQYSNGRWNDAYCYNGYRYACASADGLSWNITGAAGNWYNGSYYCQAEFGAGYQFAAPKNAQQNQKLTERKQAYGLANAWIGASDTAAEGNWVNLR